MTATTDSVTEPLEHRLALVMNGGVSLAVWMGGVAREIDNARRASNGLPLPEDASPTEKATYEAWVTATREAGARLTVDVIAGTSAGGLNGVLLAAAIARGAPLSRWLRDLWVRLGQLSEDALFKPQDDPQSLLNGDFFHEQIGKALDAMHAGPEEQRREVSLIVTSTALGPSARPVRDTAGRRFTEDDHRRRFHFSRHRGRVTYTKTGSGYALGEGDAVDHFASTEPLATAARATASFPVAFKPVAETPQLRGRRVWPDWETPEALDWLADGGILDNSPFGPLLESIQHKPVDGAWKRTVCYVVPAADTPIPTGVGHVRPTAHRGGPGPGVAAEQRPPSWISVALSGFSLPREADFRDDIEQLHETIRSGRSSLEIRRFQSLTTDDGAAQQLAMARHILAEGIALYRQSCLPTAIYQVRDILARSSEDGYLAPARAVVLGEPGGLPLYPPAMSWLPAGIPGPEDTLPTVWDWGVSAASRVLRILLRAANDPRSRLSGEVALRARLSKAVDQVTAIEWALDAYLAGARQAPGVPSDVEIVTLLDRAYADLGAPGQVASIVNNAVTAYSEATGETVGRISPVDVLGAALAVEASNGTASAPSTEPRPLFTFDRLGLDEPPALVADAYRQALEPWEGPDGRVEHPSGNDILYGSRLNHFAGFAREDWRRWDWLWGRLNALQHLASLLGLSQESVDALTSAILADEGTTQTEVGGQIRAVMHLTRDELNEKIEESGDVPVAVDSVLALLRSHPDTDPPLPQPLAHTGQLLSDALARRGHEGRVRHRAVRFAATLLRSRVWRLLDRRR